MWITFHRTPDISRMRIYGSGEDVYDYGYVDDLGYGVDFPFMNNVHYVRNDINFYMRNEKSYKHKADGLFDFDSFFNKNSNKNNKLNRNRNKKC